MDPEKRGIITDAINTSPIPGSMSLHNRIRAKRDSMVFFSITPPVLNLHDEALLEHVIDQFNLINRLSIDALLIYDLQDESSRNDSERPYPFHPRMDAFDYARDYLGGLDIPKIIYRSVGNYSQQAFEGFLNKIHCEQDLSVFVGSASSKQQAPITLGDAYRMREHCNSKLLVGGVMIPERHVQKHNEHLRMMGKICQGCDFFVSQAVYDAEAFKRVLHDYANAANASAVDPVPVVVSLVPCESQRTLEFMKWLGVSVPESVNEQLLAAGNMVDESVDIAERAWLSIKEEAEKLNVPLGCNVESLSNCTDGVNAALEILSRVR